MIQHHEDEIVSEIISEKVFPMQAQIVLYDSDEIQAIGMPHLIRSSY